MSTKMVYSIASMLLILAVAAGCSGATGLDPLSAGDPGLEQLSGSGSGSGGGAGGGDQQISPDGTTIDAGGNVTPPLQDAAGSGESAPPAGSAAQPGIGNNDVQPVDWVTYTDQQFGFKISYPKSYVILDEIERLSDTSPDLVLRVRFMDADLAAGPTASLEIPAFSIEVYSNPSVTPLGTWINGHTSPGATNEPIKVDSIQCTRVTLMTMQAPNEFVFCSTSTYIYRFTLVGPYSQEMLTSFLFGH